MVPPFTAHGRDLHKWEMGVLNVRVREGKPDVSTLTHVQCLTYDTGIRVTMGGTDAYGKSISRSAKSVLAAFAAFEGYSGLHTAWQILPDGLKKLIFKRPRL